MRHLCHPINPLTSIAKASLAFCLLISNSAFADEKISIDINTDSQENLYADREITSDDELDIINDEYEVTSTGSNGWPLYLSSEIRYQNDSSNSNNSSVSSISLFKGSLETPNYGTWFFDFSSPLNFQKNIQVSVDSEVEFLKNSWSLSQIDMPLANGISVDNFLGFHSIRNTGPVASQYRVSLPSRPIYGLTTYWEKETNQKKLKPIDKFDVWSFQLSSGRSAGLDSRGSGGIRLEDKDIFVLGGHYNFSSDSISEDPASSSVHKVERDQNKWSYGFKVASSRLRNDFFLSQITDHFSENTGIVQSLAYKSQSIKLQGNLFSSKSIVSEDVKHNTWFDGSYRFDKSRFEHYFGFNQLKSDSYWMGLPFMSGSTGGYYRLREQNPFSVKDAQIDFQRFKSNTSLSEDYNVIQFFSSNRYQKSFDVHWGSQISMMNSKESTSSILLYRDESFSGGNGQWRFFGGVERGIKNQKILGSDVQYKHDNLSFNLSGSLLMFNASDPPGRDISFGFNYHQGPFSINSGYRSFLDVGSRKPSESLFLNMNARIGYGWSLTSSLSRNLGSMPLLVTGPNGPQPILSAPNVQRITQNNFFIGLRYDFSMGSPIYPIGAQTGYTKGSGSLSGYIYLDANGNGSMESGEQRVSNTTVVLNGRYVAKTDSNGYYVFPLVSPGTYSIEIFNEDLPLPWSFDDTEKSQVNINVRSNVEFNFGATRN